MRNNIWNEWNDNTLYSGHTVFIYNLTELNKLFIIKSVHTKRMKIFLQISPACVRINQSLYQIEIQLIPVRGGGGGGGALP